MKVKLDAFQALSPVTWHIVSAKYILVSIIPSSSPVKLHVSLATECTFRKRCFGKGQILCMRERKIILMLPFICYR